MGNINDTRIDLAKCPESIPFDEDYIRFYDNGKVEVSRNSGCFMMIGMVESMSGNTITVMSPFGTPTQISISSENIEKIKHLF